MAPSPKIGDFRTPPDNEMRGSFMPGPPELTPTPTPTPITTPPPANSLPTTQAEEEGDNALTAAENLKKEQGEWLKLTPAQRYQKVLEKQGFSVTEARGIFDAVLSKGYYEEYVQVGPHKAVLRSRTYDDALRIQTALELAKPTLVLSQEDLVTRYNLASSLYEWQGKVIKHDTDADFEAVMQLLRRMPGVVYGILARRLSAFDQKVFTVFSEGSEENFS